MTYFFWALRRKVVMELMEFSEKFWINLKREMWVFIKLDKDRVQLRSMLRM